VPGDFTTAPIAREDFVAAAQRGAALMKHRGKLSERDLDDQIVLLLEDGHCLRDQALAVSGLLSRKMFGPSVYPPQPKSGLSAAFSNSTDWEASKGEDRWRRGLYTFWRRSVPYPSMATFDAPDSFVCTVKRIPTNTPLQALVMMNDPVYVECCQALAPCVTAAVCGSIKARRK
jgi:hypothetical protein